MDKLLCFLDSSTAQELGVEMTATFVGELRTRASYSPHRCATGSLCDGFGHLGAFPAQLVYKTVKDIVIRQKPQPAK